MKNPTLIIDFDSTIVKIETLDELIKLSLSEKDEKTREEILDSVKNITKQGMEGKIGFSQSLQQRISLCTLKTKHLDQISEIVKQKITDSFLKNKDWIGENRDNIFVVSGGFKECIIPVTEMFNIPTDHVFANNFLEKDGELSVNIQNPLSQTGGKILAVESLNLDGEVWMIGDGYTDFEVKKEGLASKFIYFSENIYREKVAMEADMVVNSFDEVRSLIS